MQTSQLREGREYYVSHYRARNNRARLFRIGARGHHIFQVPEDPDAETTPLIEIKVSSRNIDHEWSQRDDDLIAARAEAKAAKEAIQEKLDAVFADCPPIPFSVDSRYAHPAVEVKVGAMLPGSEQERSIILTFRGEKAVSRVLEALIKAAPQIEPRTDAGRLEDAPERSKRIT